MARFIVAAVTAALLALPAGALADEAPAPIHHLFVVVLENKDYDQSFGEQSPAPYLAKALTAQGQLLRQYYGTSHASLGNYISMISGQAPNPETQGDCTVGFKDVFPGTPAPDGQVVGSGCVYPAAVETVAGQLADAGLTWRGYMEDMGNAPGASPDAPDPSDRPTCRHPAINAVDDTQAARDGDGYATRHNPFVYFHSIIDDQDACDAGVVPLDRLPGDLASPADAPNYALIVPNLCNDGHDAPCSNSNPSNADPAGGLAAADKWLRVWVPRILGSPAFADGGALVVTWDEGNVGEGTSDACCDEPTGPNTPRPGIFGPGGGRTGTVVISPFTEPGSVNDTPYNHYALLRSVEDIFGLPHLGYAAQPGLRAFGADVFNRAPTVDLAGPPEAPTGAAAVGGCRPGRLVRARRGRLAPGSVLGRIGLARRGRRATLVLRIAHRARLTVRSRAGVRRLTVRPCRTYRVRLRGRHGRVRLAARAGGAVERRVVRY